MTLHDDMTLSGQVFGVEFVLINSGFTKPRYGRHHKIDSRARQGRPANGFGNSEKSQGDQCVQPDRFKFHLAAAALCAVSPSVTLEPSSDWLDPGVGCAIAASLVTWTADDPSLSHATDYPARNFFGIARGDRLGHLHAGRSARGRSNCPDAAGGLGMAPGFRRTHAVHQTAALATWIGGDIAAFAAALPRPARRTASWALPTGLGGFVDGDLLLRVPAFLLGGTPESFAAAHLVRLVLGACSVGLLLHATRLGVSGCLRVAAACRTGTGGNAPSGASRRDCRRGGRHGRG